MSHRTDSVFLVFPALRYTDTRDIPTSEVILSLILYIWLSLVVYFLSNSPFRILLMEILWIVLPNSLYFRVDTNTRFISSIKLIYKPRACIRRDHRIFLELSTIPFPWALAYHKLLFSPIGLISPPNLFNCWVFYMPCSIDKVIESLMQFT